MGKLTMSSTYIYILGIWKHTIFTTINLLGLKWRELTHEKPKIHGRVILCLRQLMNLKGEIHHVMPSQKSLIFPNPLYGGTSKKTKRY